VTEVINLRVYQIVEINGKTQVACRSGTKWTMDITCKSINEMLDENLIDEPTVTSMLQHLNK
jgi:hypothetical protein